VHRDLKPQNVMIDGRGQVRITRFGLRAASGHFTGAAVRSRYALVQAPEQLGGPKYRQRNLRARAGSYEISPAAGVSGHQRSE